MVNLEWLGADGAVDESRLAGTLEAFRPRLKRIVHLRLEPRLRARVDPSDIVQETFVEAIARAGGYAAEQEVPFFVWVRFLAVQKLAQAHRTHLGARKRDARREVPIRGLLGPQASSIAVAEAFAADGPTPSQHFAAKERKALVLAALESLDEPDRETLALRHVEGLSNRECAHVLDLSDAGASRRYLRAARKLGAALKERGVSGDA